MKRIALGFALVSMIAASAVAPAQARSTGNHHHGGRCNNCGAPKPAPAPSTPATPQKGVGGGTDGQVGGGSGIKLSPIQPPLDPYNTNGGGGQTGGGVA